MKKVLELFKKIAITACILYFIASILLNVFYYSNLTNQFNKMFQDKENLISTYGEQEKVAKEQIEEYKQEKGEDYPIIAMLQYTQYIIGAETLIYMQIRLAIYSVGFSIVIVCVKETIKYIKIRKDVKKNG